MWWAISDGNLSSVTQKVVDYFTLKGGISLGEFVKRYEELGHGGREEMGIGAWGTSMEISTCLSNFDFESTPTLLLHPAKPEPTWFFMKDVTGQFSKVGPRFPFRPFVECRRAGSELVSIGQSPPHRPFHSGPVGHYQSERFVHF